MSSKHTQGEWFVDDYPYRNDQGEITYAKLQINSKPGGRYSVKSIGHADLSAEHGDYFPQTVEEAEANARLLASAPALLQELKNIANADTVEWDDPTEFEAWAKNRARAAIAKATGVQS